MIKKAIALLSGGLDSTLAVKMILKQGIEVIALNFTSPFCTCNNGKGGCSEAMRVARDFGIEMKTIAKGLDYLDVLRHPRYGYGKGVNPCVDCRVYTLKKGKIFMEEKGASFIITGEVLGQRPMSQRRDTLRILERDSGLEGLILRPLSAKHMEPTLPEKTGIVDREKLLNFTGRSRKPQMMLAEALNVIDYPCPAGGCLLTDRDFSRRVRDLLDNNPAPTIKDLHLLKIGRHFRINGAKVVVGRKEEENKKIKNLVELGDILVQPHNFPAPTALIRGGEGKGILRLVVGIILKYSHNDANEERTLLCSEGDKTSFLTVEEPMENKLLARFRV
ncbi:MAG: hypothetical protein ACE5IH_04585 [Thermodesulfobacteriota bacterium]